MERIARRSLIRAGVAGLIALAFMVCSNPIDIVGNVTTEVKAANNKFLIIKGVGPAINTTNINPGASITIIFDRDISLTDIENKIQITPTGAYSLIFNYNQATKTLIIDPDPYLANQTAYNVRIGKGMNGSDGSELQNEYVWAFETGTYPAGTVTITDDAGGSLLLTNNYSAPTLKVTFNDQADTFRVGQTEEQCLASSKWYDRTGSEMLINKSINTNFTFTLDPTDGTRAAYVQFKRKSDSALSLAEFGTVTMDRTPPAVDAGSQRWVNSLNTTTPYLAAASDLNGIKSYAWSAGAPVVISPTNVLSPTLSAPVGLDGSYPVTLTVVDNAGNQASSTMTLTRDTVAPTVAPTITTPPTPTASAFPYWTWTKGAGSTGGETTPIYRAVLDGSTVVRDKSTYIYYVPPIKPPMATGLADGAHTLTVYETDNAGNLSPASLTSTVVVTVFPTNGQILVNNWTPLFQWHTMWDRNGYSAEVYYLHIGVAFYKGAMKQLALIPVTPLKIKGEIQSYQLTVKDTDLTGVKGPYYWYVDMPKQGVRSPADPYAAWSFNVTKM